MCYIYESMHRVKNEINDALKRRKLSYKLYSEIIKDRLDITLTM